MIKLQVFLSLLNMLLIYPLSAQSKDKVTEIDMIKLDFEVLSAKKSQVESNEPLIMDAYKQLLTEANKALKFKAVSVVNKKQLPPSGNKHDYMSLAPYWWPDPTKPDGLPYIRRDGETNPEVKEYSDKDNMPKMCKSVYTLALAYYFSGDEKYAKHAAELVRVFYLNSNTKMNPNLNFGQSIKGITNGRGAGIIDVRHFIFLLDAIQLLKQSKHFDENEYAALKVWFKEFLSWLRTSQIGQDEGAADNNHGVWYDALCLSISNFIGDDRLSKVIIQNAADRLDTQMDDRGLFPHELTRTISLHYTIFVLDAFYTIAQLSEEANFDFWHMETTSKKSLKKGYQTVLPYFSGAQVWEWPQIKAFPMYKANYIFSKAISKYNCTDCKDIIKKHSHQQQKLLLNLL
jgi:hypothetical protein